MTTQTISTIEEQLHHRMFCAVSLIKKLDPNSPLFSAWEFPTPLLLNWPLDKWSQHMIDVAVELEETGNRLNECCLFFFDTLPKLIYQLTIEIKGYAHTIPTGDGRRESYLRSCLILHAEILHAKNVLTDNYEEVKTRLNKQLLQRCKFWFQTINQDEVNRVDSSSQRKDDPVEYLIHEFDWFVKRICHSLSKHANYAWTAIRQLDANALAIDPTSDDIVSVVMLHTDRLSQELMYSQSAFAGETTREEVSEAQERKELESDISKKSAKREIGHKQQMLLLERLGFLSTIKSKNWTTERTARFIENLLNRDYQDTRAMLTYWDGKPEKKYDCKSDESAEKLDEFIQKYGLSNI